MDKKQFEDFINRQDWVFAKTYAKTAPHEYVLRKILSPEEQEKFNEASVFIRMNGYSEKWFGTEYIYYELDSKKYWTMGDKPKSVDDEIDHDIINRANL